MQKRQATQKYISEFKASREAWKLEEKKKMEEENSKILAFAKKMQEREAYLLSMKKEKDQAMDKVQDQVSRWFNSDPFFSSSELFVESSALWFGLNEANRMIKPFKGNCWQFFWFYLKDLLSSTLNAFLLRTDLIYIGITVFCGLTEICNTMMLRWHWKIDFHSQWLVTHDCLRSYIMRHPRLKSSLPL